MILEGEHYKQIAHIKYKYEAIIEFTTQTRVKGYEIDHKYFRLNKDGLLFIKKGYMCDGCSGITMDDKTNMHAGFSHDVNYQLLRMGKLALNRFEFNKNRKLADLSFYDQLRRDGMNWFRASYYYRAVRLFGKRHALPR
tara:strand:+ start:4507 stop:4923 length:417 start_codon:yes stop_codon:yes gene_type:complete